uniref:Uncharacterized protein n=1 Tax=Dulem virus 136 TaxID=3145613 RepID=A0AAU8AUS6_9VIRU
MKLAVSVKFEQSRKPARFCCSVDGWDQLGEQIDDHLNAFYPGQDPAVVEVKFLEV